jgi:hypothetical protein
MTGPEFPIASLLAAACVPLRNRIAGLKMMAGTLLRTATFVPPCILGVGGSPSGCPKLTGIESWRNNGKPSGRSRGSTSNTQTARACKPNEVKVVNPRRERSFHDESSVPSNMVSSSMEWGYC